MNCTSAQPEESSQVTGNVLQTQPPHWYVKQLEKNLWCFQRSSPTPTLLCFFPPTPPIPHSCSFPIQTQALSWHTQAAPSHIQLQPPRALCLKRLISTAPSLTSRAAQAFWPVPRCHGLAPKFSARTEHFSLWEVQSAIWEGRQKCLWHGGSCSPDLGEAGRGCCLARKQK